MAISAWRQRLQSGEVSSRELVDQHLSDTQGMAAISAAADTLGS